MVKIALLALLQFVLAAKSCPTSCICRSTTVHCKSLDQFPVPVPEETLLLLLNGNNIQKIPGGALTNNNHLNAIHLQDNKIDSLSLDTFRFVQRLQYLDLGGNKLTIVSDRVFAYLNQLTFLNLTHNLIKTISPEAFTGLTSLSELYLSHNQIYNLHVTTFSSLQNLSNLKLRENNLRFIPGGIFRQLNKLTHLDLSNNRLRRITSATTGGLGKLRRLELQGNHIDVLDPHILPPDSKCSQLDDDANERASRRGCLMSMHELRSVNLSNNDLSRLTYSSFGTLTKLESMSLSDNRWRCDCYLKWALDRLRHDHGNDAVAHDQVRCWYPLRFRRASIEHLEIADLAPFTNFSYYPDLQHGHGKKWRQRIKAITTNSVHQTLPTATGENSSHMSTLPAQAHQFDLQTTSASRVGLSSEARLPSKPALRSRSTFPFPDLDTTTRPYVTTHVNEWSNQGDEPKVASSGSREGTEGSRQADKNSTDRSRPAGFPGRDNGGSLEPPIPQGEAISWLLVGAIIASVIAIVVCGAVVLNRQFNSDSSRCGCCGDNDETRQCTSESIRSFSNYPLLYDNPLARRPLPRQPLPTSRELHPGVSSTANKGVDIRWTCGGSFGIGEGTPSVPPRQRSIIPGRFISRLSSSCPPPVVPPRDPIERSWDDGTSESVCSDPPRQGSSMLDLVSTDRQRPVLYVRGASSYLDIRTDASRHSYSPRKNNRRSLQIDERRAIAVQDDVTPVYYRHRRQRNEGSVSAPVSRHSSNRHGRSSRRSKRDRDVSQALGILREIETSRSYGEQRNKHQKHSNKVALKEKSRTAPETTTSQMFEGKNVEVTCVLGSVAPRRVRRGASARRTGERPVEHFYNSRKARLTVNDAACREVLHSGVRVGRSVSMKQRQHSPNLDDIDFEFPPPPPCAHTCSEESQVDTLSLSEASYDLDLPPPPVEAAFETPTSNSDLRDDACQSSDDYSVLALCATGDNLRDDDREHKSRAESQFKSALHRRLDSVDSMHASRDTNCESLSNSDESSLDTSFQKDPTPPRYDYSEVRYRQPVDRLRAETRDDYRRSMPVFNASVMHAMSGVSASRIGDSVLNGIGSDGYIYKSVSRSNDRDAIEKHFPMNRISRLDLSLSDSEWENSVSRGTNSKSAQRSSRRSSTGSTETITATKDEKWNKQESKQEKKEHEKSRSFSESSQGSESVSSIEYGSLSSPGVESTYQALRHMYSCRAPDEKKVGHSGVVPSILVHPTESSDDVRRLVFNASDLRRLYVDVAESSTDDVSTDIEMFDLGTM